MSEPVIAQKEPYAVTVEEGKSYFWCACGRSKNQPFCDGAHEGTGSLPVRWKADASGAQYFCGCKQTKTPPFCDGSHETL